MSETFLYADTWISRQGCQEAYSADDIIKFQQDGSEVTLYLCELAQLLYNVGYEIKPRHPECFQGDIVCSDHSSSSST